MATTRVLIIAGMAGTFRLGFRDLVNRTNSFTATCRGKISVERSPAGTDYTVTSSAPDFRVEIEMSGPNNLPELVHWDDCTAYGWWQLDGYEKTEFTPGEKAQAVDGSTAVTARPETPKAGKKKAS